MEWIKLAIKENLEEENKLLNVITDLFNTLSILAVTENTRQELKTRIKIKGIYFREKSLAEKQKKMENLRNKYLDKSKENEKVEIKQKPRRKWIKRSKYKKMQNKQKRQKISVVFNYSSIKLTPAMENLLNRGLQ